MTRAAFVLALIALLHFVSPSPASARMYSPCASADPTDTTPGATSDLAFHFGVGLGSDCEFGTADDAPDYLNETLVSYTPQAWGVPDDSAIADGTKVGHIDLMQTLGVLNNGCNLQLASTGDLFDATTGTANPIDALPTQSRDRLSPMARDANGNGVADGVERWPSYLTELAEKQGWSPADLRERLVGFDTTSVGGTTIVVNLLVFEPGKAGDSRLGYGTRVVFQDPTNPQGAQDPVTDWCSPTSTDWTLFGQVDGVPFRTNPTDGDYYFATYSVASPDADDDGFENALDTCPLTPDTVWSPRDHLQRNVTPDDPDADGIPNTCDPEPHGDSHNHIPEYDPQGDDDGFLNRGDNCPLVDNEDQLDSDGDGIGDACDPNPEIIDGAGTFGARPSMCNVTEVPVGSGGAGAQINPRTLIPCGQGGLGDADCAGGVNRIADVLAILAELGGTYQHTICFPDADTDCNGELDLGDALLILRLNADYKYILRPCSWPGGAFQ